MIPRLFRTPLVAVMSAILLSALPVPAVQAQEKAPAATAPQATETPAPASAAPASATVSVTDANVAETARQQITDAAQTLTALNKQVKDAASDDEKLTDLKLKTDDLRK